MRPACWGSRQAQAARTEPAAGRTAGGASRVTAAGQNGKSQMKESGEIRNCNEGQ